MPVEVFVGFYAVDDAQGTTLIMTIKDVLLRLQLPISLLRGQTYDDVANMSDTYNGAQAFIRQDQLFMCIIVVLCDPCYRSSIVRILCHA